MPWSPRHHHLRFAVEHGESQAIVRLAGELDFASAAIAHLALERVSPHLAEVTLDLSRVVFLDASGVRFLISAQRRARAARRRIVIRQPSRSVRRMLELTGARPLLVIEDSDDCRPDDPAVAEVIRILDGGIEVAMRIAHADGSTAQLLDPSTGELRIVAQRGFNSVFLDCVDIVTDTESVCGMALRRGRPVWVADIARSTILAATPALDALLDAGVRSLAVVPIKCDSGPIAALSLHHRAPAEWSAEQRIELEELGRSIARQYPAALRLPSGMTGAAAM
ncbi:MAG: anti-sigma factor antagonist [Solirubrobacteraceae bacterium]